MAAAVLICEKCGAKLRPGRERCPRCRAFLPVANPARERETSRKLATITAFVAGSFVVLLAGLWIWREWGTPRAPAKSVTPPVAAAPREAPAPVSEGAKPLPQLGRDRPFMDPSGAGAVAYGEGDYATALAQFQAAVEKNPQDSDSLSNLGQVLVKVNRPADAIPYLTRAVSLAPDRWAYQFNLARALGLVGRLDESIQGYRAAQLLFPNDYVTTFNLALSLHKKGDEAAAVEQYQKAIDLQPEDASFRKALGISYERLQKGPEAAAAYQEYLRLSPDAPDADKVRERIVELTGRSVPSS
ncbi:MAG TPA: tetratricopeptide repeat protein [Vicinamibacterales bacterium]|nr:tetratricopeptide repeat protein [Vicinamibacterales bacterium]